MVTGIYKALAITERKQKTPLTLMDFKPAEPGEHEQLIENVAAAQNPADWKMIDYDMWITSLPFTGGCDVAGTVSKVGPGVTEFKEGDRVISFLELKTPRHAAYQTYSVATELQTLHLPESYSFEEGCTIPGCGVAASRQLQDLSMGLNKGEPLLVWDGASSVGMFVVHLARLSGYTVIATASTKHHEYLKSIGAEYVFDYHDSDVIEKIRSAAGPNLSLAYDAISERSSTPSSIASLSSPNSSKVAVIRSAAAATPSPSHIKVVLTGAIRAAQNVAGVGKHAYAFLQEVVNRGLLRGNPIRIMPGGLGGVSEGLDLGRAYKVSGEKLVYRIADTEW